MGDGTRRRMGSLATGLPFSDPPCLPSYLTVPLLRLPPQPSMGSDELLNGQIEELQLLKSSLTQDEFRWRGTAVEVEAWEAALEDDGPSSTPPPFTFAIRISEQPEAWLEVGLPSKAEKEVQADVSSQQCDASGLQDVRAAVRRRMEESGEEGE